MKLDICGTRTVDSPSAHEIQDAISELDASDDPFLILGPNELTYIQCSGNRESEFVVEHQEGSVEQHFRATDALDATTIWAMFSDYARGGHAWRDAANWERVTW